MGLASSLLSEIYEYRRLLARRELMGGNLSSESRRRLEHLQSALNDEDPGSKRNHSRTAVRLQGKLTLGQQVREISVTDLGGGGMKVTPAPMARPGEVGVVEVIDEEAGTRYRYPVRVAWCFRDAAHSALGLPFAGAPKRG